MACHAATPPCKCVRRLSSRPAYGLNIVSAISQHCSHACSLPFVWGSAPLHPRRRAASRLHVKRAAIRLLGQGAAAAHRAGGFDTSCSSMLFAAARSRVSKEAGGPRDPRSLAFPPWPPPPPPPPRPPCRRRHHTLLPRLSQDRPSPTSLPSLRLRPAPCSSSQARQRRRRTAGSSQPHSWHTGGGNDSYTDGEFEGGATTAVAAAPSEHSALSSGDEEGRWHDAMQRALMDSLQPPRAEHPSWWGKRFHHLQVRLPGWAAAGRGGMLLKRLGCRAQAGCLLHASPPRLLFHATALSRCPAAPRSAAWPRCWRAARRTTWSSAWCCWTWPSCWRSWCCPASTPCLSWRRTWVRGRGCEGRACIMGGWHALGSGCAAPATLPAFVCFWGCYSNVSAHSHLPPCSSCGGRGVQGPRQPVRLKRCCWVPVSFLRAGPQH